RPVSLRPPRELPHPPACGSTRDDTRTTKPSPRKLSARPGVCAGYTLTVEASRFPDLSSLRRPPSLPCGRIVDRLSRTFIGFGPLTLPTLTIVPIAAASRVLVVSSRQRHATCYRATSGQLAATEISECRRTPSGLKVRDFG